jgi:hypothetical protein
MPVKQDGTGRNLGRGRAVPGGWQFRGAQQRQHQAKGGIGTPAPFPMHGRAMAFRNAGFSAQEHPHSWLDKAIQEVLLFRCTETGDGLRGSRDYQYARVCDISKNQQRQPASSKKCIKRPIEF